MKVFKIKGNFLILVQANVGFSKPKGLTTFSYNH
jgi:hypothetical protein